MFASPSQQSSSRTATMKRRLMASTPLVTDATTAADARDECDNTHQQQRAGPRYSQRVLRSGDSFEIESKCFDDEGGRNAPGAPSRSSSARGLPGMRHFVYTFLLVTILANLSRPLQIHLTALSKNGRETYDNVDDGGIKNMAVDKGANAQGFPSLANVERKKLERFRGAKSGNRRTNIRRFVYPPSAVGALPSTWILPLPGVVGHISFSESKSVTAVLPKSVFLDGMNVRFHTTNDSSHLQSKAWSAEQRNEDSHDADAVTKSSTVVWDEDQECVPMSDWQTTFHPTCNSFHEMDTATLFSDDSLSLISSKGFWRDAWKLDLSRRHVSNSTIVAKALKITESKRDITVGATGPTTQYVVFKSVKFVHNVNDEVFELQKTDAVALDQLTSSRHVTNIYGFCGFSSVTEFAGGDLKIKLPELPPVLKLRTAMSIAESIADVHAIDGEAKGSLIHNDVNMDNVLLGYRGGVEVPLLNDFNIAVFRRKDAAGEPCRFRGRFANPQWMSPEQMERDDELSVGYLNEKVDVYALGNILYKIVVGHSPWKYNFKVNKITKELKEKIARAKLRGAKPKVPDHVQNAKDPYITAILSAMNRCYRNNPDARPTAREIAHDLREVYQQEQNAVGHGAAVQ